MNYANRRKEVLNRMKRSGANAFLISNPVNIFYLTGFNSSNVFVFLTEKETFLFTDFRYEEVARELCKDQNIGFIILNKKLTHFLKRLSKKYEIKKIAFEADDLKVAAFNLLKKNTQKIKWTEAKSWISDIRKNKDNNEIEIIKKAILVAEQGFKSIKSKEWIGLTEIEASDLLAEKIKIAGKKMGVRAVPSFDFVVAAGANAAVPHHAPENVVIKNNDMLKVDWGAKVEDYCSDMTRTLYFGKPTAKFRKIYNTVLRANKAAIRAVRSGVILKNIDASARKIIDEAGYAKNFGHGTGHGVGLEVHDGPGPSPRCVTRTSKGMVITIEPGIYIPGWGGIRIEDMVLVTSKGPEVLTRLCR